MDIYCNVLLFILFPFFFPNFCFLIEDLNPKRKGPKKGKNKGKNKAKAWEINKKKSFPFSISTL